MEPVCPKCQKWWDDENDTPMLIPLGDHYMCSRCKNDDGTAVQFKVIPDEKKEFPYSQIFLNRPNDEFYREEYLKLRKPSALKGEHRKNDT